MPSERFYIDAPFAKGDLLILKDEEFHHLCHVMRLRKNDELELINGKNLLAKAIVESIEKKSVHLKITEITIETQLAPRIILAQAIPRLNRLEYIIEKGTELGVCEFRLFPGSYSEKVSMSENQKLRLQHLTVAAMKQSGRLDLPSISMHPPLKKWQKFEGIALFGDPDPSFPYIWELPRTTFTNRAPLIFFIGPEKGFSPEERLILQQTLAAPGVRLHPNTLRVDTASLAAISIIYPFLIN
ncbi:MAG TPA: RsmE family RNA methyltransferase [Syntrophales bacterium]|nr:RsmE family RNA methyltransferase [Rhabdochlamydiaceae bacterium]HLE19287.1 RsmE family RNA methyltransferase [Syntrophales bacterium]